MEIYMVNDLEPYGLSMIFLVGGIPTPLKNDGVNVSWDDEIPNIWKTCSKPPTSYGYINL